MLITHLELTSDPPQKWFPFLDTEVRRSHTGQPGVFNLFRGRPCRLSRSPVSEAHRPRRVSRNPTHDPQPRPRSAVVSLSTLTELDLLCVHKKARRSKTNITATIDEVACCRLENLTPYSSRKLTYWFSQGHFLSSCLKTSRNRWIVKSPASKQKLWMNFHHTTHDTELKNNQIDNGSGALCLYHTVWWHSSQTQFWGQWCSTRVHAGLRLGYGSSSESDWPRGASVGLSWRITQMVSGWTEASNTQIRGVCSCVFSFFSPRETVCQHSDKWMKWMLPPVWQHTVAAEGTVPISYCMLTVYSRGLQPLIDQYKEGWRPLQYTCYNIFLTQTTVEFNRLLLFLHRCHSLPVHQSISSLSFEHCIVVFSSLCIILAVLHQKHTARCLGSMLVIYIALTSSHRL